MIDVGKKERLKFMYIAQYIREKLFILVQDSLSFCKERMTLSLRDYENRFSNTIEQGMSSELLWYESDIH